MNAMDGDSPVPFTAEKDDGPWLGPHEGRVDSQYSMAKTAASVRHSTRSCYICARRSKPLTRAGRSRQQARRSKRLTGALASCFPVHLVQIPFRLAALRGRYYVHLVQMHGPFPNSVRVGAPLFGGLSPGSAGEIMSIMRGSAL